MMIDGLRWLMLRWLDWVGLSWFYIHWEGFSLPLVIDRFDINTLFLALSLRFLPIY